MQVIDWKRLDMIQSDIFSIGQAKKKKKIQYYYDIENTPKGKNTTLSRKTQERPISSWTFLLHPTARVYTWGLKYVLKVQIWAISEKWFIIGWSTLSSAVKVKIHLHNSPIHHTFTKSIIEMCRKYTYDNY